MKITSLAAAFAMIVFPFFIINQIHADGQKLSLRTEMRYNAAIDAAVQDAALMLIPNEKQEFEAQYESAKNVRANLEAAMDAFYRTLYVNFGIADDPQAQALLDVYIPAIVVIGYDGYYLYADDEFANRDGEPESRHVWYAKKPYAYRDAAGNSLSFTLDEFVTAYEPGTQTWRRGFRRDIASSSAVPLLQDAAVFEQVRRWTIVSSIQGDLQYYINRHNAVAKRYGVSYTFTLPAISGEEWNNTIQDVGVIAFVQGIPIGDRYYNNYALGGARIVKRGEFAGIFANGIKYYYRRSECSSPLPTQETFQSEKEAARNGYYPLACANLQ